MMLRLPPSCHHLLDDASPVLSGEPAGVAVARRASLESSPYADLLGGVVVTDRQLGSLEAAGRPGADAGLVLSVSGGAGGVVPALRLAAARGLRPTRVETALRDPDDLVGNARRVVAAVASARGEGLLAVDAGAGGEAEIPVHVELPVAQLSVGWLGAADEAAAAGLRLTLRVAGAAAAGPGVVVASWVASWVDAALDRETPFGCLGGGLRAAAYAGRPGVLSLLLATGAAFEGAGRDEVARLLEDPHPRPEPDLLVAGRRWCSRVATEVSSGTLTELGRVLEVG